jgi:hypothetical protein
VIGLDSSFLSRTNEVLRYQYPDNPEDLGKSISGAQYVEDVNADPVVIINGLTKGFRRVCTLQRSLETNPKTDYPVGESAGYVDTHRYSVKY